MRASLLCRLFNLLPAGSRLSIGDIFRNRPGKEVHFLLHNANLPAQRGKLHGAHIHPIQQNGALLHIVEARDQLA